MKQLTFAIPCLFGLEGLPGEVDPVPAAGLPRGGKRADKGRISAAFERRPKERE